jgi:uncharacterized membrane protein
LTYAFEDDDPSMHLEAQEETMSSLSEGNGSRRRPALAAATAATAAAMLALDLLWLGILVEDFYDTSLGSLKRPDVYWPAAALFYSFYVAAIVVHAVRGAATPAAAARRGAALGLVAYGTYELTNWAVLRDWPARLVPVDLAWGIGLTAVAGFVGKWVFDKVTPAPPRTAP